MTDSQHNTENILKLSSAPELIGIRRWTVECHAVSSQSPVWLGAHVAPNVWMVLWCAPSNSLPMIVGTIPHMYLQKVALMTDEYLYASILCLHNPTFHTVSTGTSELPIAF
jgi:hypothetical protein